MSLFLYSCLCLKKNIYIYFFFYLILLGPYKINTISTITLYFVLYCHSVQFTATYFHWSWTLLFDCVSSWAWYKQKVAVSRDKTSPSVFSAPWTFSKEFPSLPNLVYLRNQNLTLAGMVRTTQQLRHLINTKITPSWQKGNDQGPLHPQAYWRQQSLLRDVSRSACSRPPALVEKTASTWTSGFPRVNKVAFFVFQYINVLIPDTVGVLFL